MLRLLYICLVYLHPARFRREFGGEMLWIYDQSVPRASARLVADALRSLACQWLLRPPRPAPEPSARTADGVPVFYLCGSDVPASSALVHGAGLSLILFGLVLFAMARGGGHFVLAGNMPGILHWNFGIAMFEGRPDRPGVGAGAGSSGYAFDFRTTDLFRALDADGDGRLSSAEIANAAAALRSLDRDHDGKLSPRECGYRRGSFPFPIFTLLDADDDGTLSGEEIAAAPAALKRFLPATH